MIGRTISRYKIIEKLGEGGMGVVYKAQDSKLKRTVALKFLTPHALGSKEERKPLVQEAQAAAVLNHPHIATIYEIDEVEDQTFIAMEYIDGQSLKEKTKSGPLKLEEALEIIIQIAEGLQEAHQKDIIHRDMKSGNIMVTSKGQVKIMDFGLAKTVKGRLTARDEIKSGTVAYMSPEQATGGSIDVRTDIWSLGVVLYEMVAGQLPFKGNYNEAVIYSVLNEEPISIKQLRPRVPMELGRILNKALAKSPDDRYQQISDMLVDLRSVRSQLKAGIFADETAGARPQPSIAVLPFANLTADPEQEYFCDGMAEEIINALTQVEGLRVVARTSAFSFRGKEIDIREIGRKLNVDKLLEGSVRKAGNRVRITAQLVNVADGYHLWSEKYDRDMEDIFAIQDEVTLAIVDKLKVKLFGGEKAKLMKRYTDNLEAYSLYLKGRHYWQKRTEEGFHKGLQYFRQAIEEDPAYSLAFAGIADSYILLAWFGYLPPKEAFPKAKAAAEKALERDDTLAEARTSLAAVREFFDWDWLAAETEFKRAIELNASYATAHQWYAEYLSEMERHNESMTEAKRAQELDPLSPIIGVTLGWTFHLARQYDKAIEELQKTLEIDPKYMIAHYYLAHPFAQKAMYNEAVAEVQRAVDLSGGGDPLIVANLGVMYSLSGRRKEAMKVLDELCQLSKLRYVSPFFRAMIYGGLGQKDQAFVWLEKAYEERAHWLVFLKVEPVFDRIRSDPRFKALLKKIGLEK